jgi:hypothetical protein
MLGQFLATNNLNLAGARFLISQHKRLKMRQLGDGTSKILPDASNYPGPLPRL